KRFPQKQSAAGVMTLIRLKAKYSLVAGLRPFPSEKSLQSRESNLETALAGCRRSRLSTRDKDYVLEENPTPGDRPGLNPRQRNHSVRQRSSVQYPLIPVSPRSPWPSEEYR